MIYLASDNYAPAHPSILAAVAQANEGYAPSYGSDMWTENAIKWIQNTFKSSCKVHIVPNGTGANVLALKLSCRRHESVLCSDIAHLLYHESGAPESVVGCKILCVPHRKGKIYPEEILKTLHRERMFGSHSTSPRVLSITQPTEVGTVYTIQELKTLAHLCQEENLLFHMDGSRLYNAAAHLNISLHELSKGLDVLSLGGTKNGLMGAEALLIFNESLHEGSDHLQKQSLLLTSKMRYLSAQFIPYFEKKLWRSLAESANQRALEIATVIEENPQFCLSYPVETNQVFFSAPSSWLSLIQERVHCYPWDQEKNEIRFVTSWNTSKEDVEGLKSVLNELGK